MENIQDNNKKEHYKISFLPMDETVICSQGKSLADAANVAGINLVSDCGGKGFCKKCKLKLKSGMIRSTNPFALSQLAGDDVILACTCFPVSDVTVEVPESSMTEERKPSCILLEKSIEADLPYTSDPLVEKHFVECPPPAANDNTDDLARLKLALFKKTGIGDFKVNHKILQSLPELLRNSGWKITLTLSKAESPPMVLAAEEGDVSEQNYGIVVDIGTTTIEAALVEVATGNIKYFYSFINPQQKYGSDVISRMNFASKDRGVLILNDLIIDRVNEILLEMISQTGISQEHIYSIVISANTVMTHFFLGIDTESLRKEPNVAAALVYPVFSASELNLYANHQAPVYIVPGAGSYAGGDIISSLISTGMKDDDFVLADLGTNGEVAAMFDGAIVCAATSAGPAFEGSGMKCGTQARDGAIDHVCFDPETGKLSYTTINNRPPAGICGTGFIDLIAAMLKSGIIDRKGHFTGKSADGKIIKRNNAEEFILSGDASDDHAIGITDQDIDYFIKSKGAIYTGLTFLINRLDRKESDIKKFYIAGALGGMIDIESGIQTGLFPEIDTGKFKFLGNGSLLGGWMLLLSAEARKKAEEIAKTTLYFELSREPDYMNAYTSSLFLPHTDLARFPGALTGDKIRAY